jgi:hypothetical protein
MTIKKAVRKTALEVPSTDIDRVINAGSPPPGSEDENISDKTVKFQMVIPFELCSLIDGARQLTKTSRRTWLLQAAQEKLQREGKL